MATCVMPDRSYVQRMEALERANAVRSYRAEVKRELKAGRLSRQLTIAAPPAELLTMKVFELLQAMPKIGRVKATQILSQCAISPSKLVGGLSDRQRREVLGMLGRLP